MAFNFSKEEFDKISKEEGSCLLFKKILVGEVTPVLASLKLFEKFPKNHFLFESAEKGSKKSRFSVIGLDPDLSWKSIGEKSFIDGEEESGKVFDNLRNLINNSKINWDSLEYGLDPLPAISAGIFGYMSYDMVKLMENLPNNNLPDELNIPDSQFIRPQIIIIFDNKLDCAIICAPLFKGNTNSYEKLSEKITKIENIILESGPVNKGNDLSDKIDFQFTSNYTEEEYCNSVEKAKEYITNGDVFQVLPSQRFTSKFDKTISEFSFYRALREVNPSPFLFYVKLDDFSLVGSSPEIMVSLINKKVTLRPLAGTRKRGKNEAEDQEIAKELLKDEKEVAEHLMLIDLGRHDVGKVSKPGTVKLTEKMIIEYYSHVMHISSNVEGTLRDDLDALDALISGFPAGTVSGAPKIRAMEIIEELEKVKRSFYAGCVGYFAANGDMETCITLRSALIKNEKIYLQAGAGVVFDSNPKMEYQECINKAQALIKACERIAEFL